MRLIMKKRSGGSWNVSKRRDSHMRVLIRSVLQVIAAISGALAIQYAEASSEKYELVKGDKAQCMPFITRVRETRTVKPVLQRSDPKWTLYKSSCPDLLKKESWMRGSPEYDDYKLYQADIDNDGRDEDVLYRRFDRELFTTYRDGGRETRRLTGTESVEQLHVVDLQSCQMEKVFGGYAKTDLILLDGQTYIQNVNPRDVGKAKAIYKKKKGSPVQGGYQDQICLFKHVNQSRGDGK